MVDEDKEDVAFIELLVAVIVIGDSVTINDAFSDDEAIIVVFDDCVMIDDEITIFAEILKMFLFNFFFLIFAMFSFNRYLSFRYLS